MFDSVYSVPVQASEFFLMMAVSIFTGFLYAWIMSFRIPSTKRFFIVVAIMPFIVSAVITFVNGNIGAGVAVGGAFSLIRFRSAPGSAEEIAAILIAMGSGIAFGMGYIAYGVIILVLLSIIFVFLSLIHIFEHNKVQRERLLRITIPESLEYSEVFDDTFSRYLSSYENVGVKTTAMGSMFKLSFKIKMKDRTQEKEFIDELRTKNGNLEISILPYVDQEYLL